MKQITLFLTAIIILATIGSCKKNKIITPTVTYPNYSGLKVGNYWIYQQFDVDENGIAKSKNIFDSCYVEKDTVIRGKTYYKLVKSGGFYEISFQRDSLHYLVNSDGQILFSSEDFTSIFETSYQTAGSNDTIAKYTRQMSDKNQIITTAAGTFTTSNVNEKFSMYPKWSSAGSIRNKNTRYSEKVGIVTETLPIIISNPTYTERRLLRYSVK